LTKAIKICFNTILLALEIWSNWNFPFMFV